MNFESLINEIENDLHEALRRYGKVELEPQLMRELATVENSLPVRLFLASHPSTPGRIVEQMFHEGVPEVLEVLATHPRLPSNMVQQLLRGDDERVRLALAGSKSMSNSSWAVALCADPSWRVRVRLAQNSSIGPRAQAFLSDDPLPFVRSAMLKHPRLDEEVLGVLCDDCDFLVQCKAAQLPKLPLQMLRKFAQSESEALQLIVANRRQLPPVIVQTLCSSEFSSVREALMNSQVLPEEVLMKFAHEGDETLRLKIASQEGVALAVQRVLSTDASLAVRCALCGNASLDDGLGVFMAVGGNPDILRALAVNTGRLPNVWTLLLQQGDDELKKLMLSNESLPQDVIEQIAAGADECLSYHLQYRRLA